MIDIAVIQDLHVSVEQPSGTPRDKPQPSCHPSGDREDVPSLEEPSFPVRRRGCVGNVSQEQIGQHWLPN
jgi:hypothetical protein